MGGIIVELECLNRSGGGFDGRQNGSHQGLKGIANRPAKSRGIVKHRVGVVEFSPLVIHINRRPWIGGKGDGDSVCPQGNIGDDESRSIRMGLTTGDDLKAGGLPRVVDLEACSAVMGYSESDRGSASGCPGNSRPQTWLSHNAHRI